MVMARQIEREDEGMAHYPACLEYDASQQRHCQHWERGYPCCYCWGTDNEDDYCTGRR